MTIAAFEPNTRAEAASGLLSVRAERCGVCVCVLVYAFRCYSSVLTAYRCLFLLPFIFSCLLVSFFPLPPLWSLPASWLPVGLGISVASAARVMR